MKILIKKYYILLTSITLAVTLSTTCLADSTILIQADSGDATLQIKNGRILFKSTDPTNTANIQGITVSEVVFDTQLQTLYLIDHTQSTVSPVTKATIEQLSGTIDAAVEILDSMPAGQRDSISNLMRGFGIPVPETETAPSIELMSLSKQEFRGIKCQESLVTESEQELGKVCITQENSTPLTNEDYQSLINTQEFFLYLAKQAKPFTQQYGHSMPNLDGIELSGLIVYSQQTNVEPGTPSANFVITDVDLSPVEEINLPADYKSKPLL